MNNNQIMKTDILDIVFEKRNKAYGAYILRKFYPNRIKLALGFMFIIALAFSAFTLIPKKDNTVVKKEYDIKETILKQLDITPVEPIKPPVLKSAVAAVTTPVNQKKFIKNILIVDDAVKTDKLNTILPTDPIGTQNISDAKPATDLFLPVKAKPGIEAIEKVEPQIDINKPFEAGTVEVMPAFPGGMDALRKYLERNLNNPYDLENGETISVQIKFVVGYNGKLQGFVTVLDGGEAYNKEVIRVLKKMPDWIPGKTKGQNVSVYYTIPVKFVMSN